MHSTEQIQEHRRHLYANQFKIFKAVCFFSFRKSRLYELQMATAKNNNQEQSEISNINIKLQEILALAKEVEHLTKSKEN